MGGSTCYTERRKTLRMAGMDAEIVEVEGRVGAK
jgi:hypothetical protein